VSGETSDVVRLTMSVFVIKGADSCAESRNAHITDFKKIAKYAVDRMNAILDIRGADRLIVRNVFRCPFIVFSVNVSN